MIRAQKGVKVIGEALKGNKETLPDDGEALKGSSNALKSDQHGAEG